MTKKYLYHIPGRPEELTSENYLVGAEEQVSVNKPLIINLEEAQQIYTLLKETGFFDFHQYNIIRNKENKLAIIDSENFDFNENWGTCIGLKRIITKGFFDLNAHFTEEALKYILMRNLECMTPTTSQYKTIYYRLLGYLEDQDQSSSLNNFKESFPEPINL